MNSISTITGHTWWIIDPIIVHLTWKGLSKNFISGSSGYCQKLPNFISNLIISVRLIIDFLIFIAFWLKFKNVILNVSWLMSHAWSCGQFSMTNRANQPIGNRDKKYLLVDRNIFSNLTNEPPQNIKNPNRINLPSPHPQWRLFSLALVHIFTARSAMRADLFYWDGLYDKSERVWVSIKDTDKPDIF